MKRGWHSNGRHDRGAAPATGVAVQQTPALQVYLPAGSGLQSRTSVVHLEVSAGQLKPIRSVDDAEAKQGVPQFAL